ncbi:MAG: diacylglycerol kinase family protein [bacterium]|nr:diacylglycerol kinase family protein [bacterium]
MRKKKNSLIKSFYHAFVGIGENLRRERNLKIHFFMMFLVVILGILLEICVAEWIVCFLLFGSVISSELMNTAIEGVVDIYVKEIDEEARVVKDTAAGAVLITAIIAIIVGLLIFVPKILDFIS